MNEAAILELMPLFLDLVKSIKPKPFLPLDRTWVRFTRFPDGSPVHLRLDTVFSVTRGDSRPGKSPSAREIMEAAQQAIKEGKDHAIVEIPPEEGSPKWTTLLITADGTIPVLESIDETLRILRGEVDEPPEIPL